MPAIAHQKGVRISPRKVAVVASLVRGRTVEDALTILEYTPRRAALPVREAIKSAAANAEHNHNYKPGTLEIIEVQVTAGRRLKRWIPAARGRARRFQRKTSHIKVVVDGQLREIKKTAARKAVSAKQETE
ncbi:MAG TPA: 50S ribosomal protein L22 [Candidatus Saccharimonadales bacterium]|nr:50S ribosomal protein L22 [Candidatus Saccharimonadales bacterium]